MWWIIYSFGFVVYTVALLSVNPAQRMLNERARTLESAETMFKKIFKTEVIKLVEDIDGVKRVVNEVEFRLCKLETKPKLPLLTPL